MAFDLDKVIAERETKKKPFTFKFDGKTYSLPARTNLLSLAAIAAGRLDDGLRMMLGDAQYEIMQSSEKVFDADALNALYEAYAEYTGGTSAGESSASPSSSKSTVTPLKPRSKPSTASRSRSSARR